MECKLDDVTIHYEMRGEGRAIVALSGWSLDHRQSEADLEPLFEKRSGWKRIYPDLPGTGASPKADSITGADDLLDVIVRFIDGVIPGERCAVMGTSYGGYLARGVVHRCFDRLDGLFITVAPILADPEKRTLPQHVTLVQDASIFAGMDAAQMQEFQEIAVVQSRKVLDFDNRVIAPAVQTADMQFLEKVREHYGFSFDVDALPKPFPRPALFLMGRQDSVCGYRDAWQIIENYPRATFAVLDRAGHMVSIEQEGLYRALVSEWLDRVEEG